MFYPTEFGSSRSSGTSVIKEIRLKNLTLVSRLEGHSRSAKLTRIDPSNDFLLTFRSNHGPISYRLRDKWRFQSKIANFSQPRVFCAPMKRFVLELDMGALGQKKTRTTGLPDRERSFTISSPSGYNTRTTYTVPRRARLCSPWRVLLRGHFV